LATKAPAAVVVVEGAVVGGVVAVVEGAVDGGVVAVVE
jgi:hypothetical protein